MKPPDTPAWLFGLLAFGALGAAYELARFRKNSARERVATVLSIVRWGASPRT